MERINNENTSLGTIGLTVDMIKQGEVLEFDPEKKLNRRGEYVSLDQVSRAIGLYAKDLLQAYTVIEEMEAEMAEIKENLDEVTKAAQTSAAQVKQVLAGEKRFTESETKLAEMAASLEKLKQSNEDDKAYIAELQSQMKEFQDMADQVPELAQDVQIILDALEASIKEAGLSIDDILDSLPDEE